MNILLVTSVMPIRGGVATWVNTAAEELRRNGHEVKVINAASGKADNLKLFSAQITNTFSKLLNFDVVFLIAFLLTGMLLKMRIAVELKNKRYDVVHAQDLNAYNAAYRLCKNKGCKLVLTIHGHLYNGGTSSRAIESHGWLSSFLFREEKHALQHARKIITVSRYSYNFVKHLNPEARIELIRNFVDIKTFYPLEKSQRERIRARLSCHNSDFIVLSVGRLARGKGVNYVLEGIAGLFNNIPVKLIIAGNGPEYTDLLNITKEREISQYVSFVGELTTRELLDIYNTADVFVIASVTGKGTLEGTPMSLLEAMACGLPVVATPVGGIADLIQDGINGILIQEKDGDSLASSLRLLYENQELRQKLSNAALATIQQEYSVDKVIARLIEIYNSR